MQCPNCHHVTKGGNFCENCGKSLVTQPQQYQREAAASTETAPLGQGSNQGQQYLESTKNVSKMYFGYFVEVLKKPFASSRTVGAEHFTNAIITMVLYSLLLPLISYFALKAMLGGFMDPSLMDAVIKPFFSYALLILSVTAFTFLAVKWGKAEVSFKDVFSRFGSLLIPFIAIFAVSFVLAILQSDLYSLVFNLGFTGSMFLIPPLVIASYKKEYKSGLDIIYSTLLTYVLTFLVTYILGDLLFDSFFSNPLGGMINF